MDRRSFIKTAGITGMAGALGALGLAGCAPSSGSADGKDGLASTGGAYTPGIYEATVNGHNGPLEFKVKFSENAVTEISTGYNLESDGVGLWAIDKLSHDVISFQSLNCDTVTGATVTSMALLEAVRQCAEEAGGTEALDANEGPQCDYAETYDADICVIGAGGAGGCAAITAAKAGAKVVIMEKCGITGGSTNVCGGALNAVDPYRQEKQGIEDSIETFFQVTMEGGHNVANPELVHFLTDHAMESVEWLEDLGCAFRMKIGSATGSLGERSHYNAKYSGSGYTDTFRDYYAKNPDKITILTECPAQEIIKDASGAVAGVRGQHRSGMEIVVNAKAVIVATGGFGANAEYRQSVNDGVWGDVDLGPGNIGCSNISVCAQGDGLHLAEAAGAELIGLSDIQVHPGGCLGSGLIRHIHTSGRNRIFVNELGDRFVDEGAARDVLARAVYAQPNSQMWEIVNTVRYPTPTTPDSNGETIEDMLALDAIVAGDTVEELAAATGMDAAKLQASIDSYNATVRGAEDPFGFKADNVADKEMAEGPWYASKKCPTIHHTMGGIRVNVRSEAEGADGTVIPGLYAAGEVTGGIQGANRLGGNAIADCMTFGRNAGEQAAIYVGIDPEEAHAAAVVL